MQSDGRLDLTTRHRVFLVVVRQSRGLCRDTLENVVDERVHYAHSLRRDACIGVDLFQHLVNVDRVALLAALSSLLSTLAALVCLEGGLLFSFL